MLRHIWMRILHSTTHLCTKVSERRMTFCRLSLWDFFTRPLSEQNWRRAPGLLVKSARFNLWARLPIFRQVRKGGSRSKVPEEYLQRVSALLLAQCSETARANAPCVIVWYESSSCICIWAHCIEHCSVAAPGEPSRENVRTNAPCVIVWYEYSCCICIRGAPHATSILWTQLMHLPRLCPHLQHYIILLPMRAIFLIVSGNY